MKQIVLLCLSITFTVLGFSQPHHYIKYVPHIYQGEITLMDGTSFNFTNLEVQNDTVIFTDPQSNECKYPGGEVYKISRPGTYAAAGAIASGSVVLFTSIIVASKWSKYTSDGINRRKPRYVIGATAAFAAIGGLVGAFINREKTVYKNNTAISFGLDYESFIVNEPVVMLALKIKL